MLRNNAFERVDHPCSVDIITVWYNREDFVYDSIMSLIDQTHQSYRIIAVDDGSTDKTVDFLKNMLRIADDHDIPMCLWDKKNEGFTVSLKKAIEKKCDADTIALHGAGDQSSPERIRVQYELLSSGDDIVATGVSSKTINMDGEVLNTTVLEREPSYDLSRGKVPRLGTHGCAMYDFDAYKKVGGYRTEFLYSQDIDLWLRLINVGKFRRSKEVLYSRLYGDINVASNDCMTRFQQILCYEAAIQSEIFKMQGKSDPIEDLESQNMDKISNIATTNGFHDESMKKLARLVFHSSLKFDVGCIRRVMSLFSPRDFLMFVNILLILGYKKVVKTLH